MFALHNGRLVEAPEYAQSSADFARDILRAVQSQTLALIQRPLFPIGYVTNQDSREPQQSLVTMDSDKRVVTIEVFHTLNAQALVQATARAGRFSALNRQQLTDIYPGTEQDFAHRWGLFLDSTTPTPHKASRLYIFCLEIDDQARNSLSGVDIDVKLILPHDGAEGTLVEVVDVDRYVPCLLNKPVAPWMIGSKASEEGSEDELLDQSLWNIQGWAQRPDIPSLPYHQAVAQTSPKVVMPQDAPDFVAISADRADDSEESTTPAPRADTAIMLAELSNPPRRLSRRARRLANNQSATSDTSADAPSQSETSAIPSFSEPTLPNSKSGTVLYEQLLERSKRAEQRLWDQSAPKMHAETTIYSEGESATEAERAVAEAAEHDRTKLADWISHQRAAYNKSSIRRSRRSRRH
ncbi:hypothetical protein HC352_01185 [Arcanobacterium buesumense]|uniref:Uncharacterized protein n=1 Tax=Arcanobacterium buesumense TaxID=2722751 RepID=A0A6H2EKM7_9ACTO|nr:hypothetical protein HC352_01185 [Arcanobacterium buesumense]